jgi:quercetin dioxygenase-like cupin family protein
MVFSSVTGGPFVVRPEEGLDAPLARLGAVHKVASDATEGRLAIVEHTLPPRHLAAPLHRHSREDELSIVLEGELGAQLGDEMVLAGEGCYVFKPRGQWHTFWNAGFTKLRFIELIVPGGFDGYFRRLSPLLAARGGLDPDIIRTLGLEYGIEFDFDSVPDLCERHGLTFG